MEFEPPVRYPVIIPTGPSSGLRIHNLEEMKAAAVKLGMSKGFALSASPQELLGAVQTMASRRRERES